MSAPSPRQWPQWGHGPALLRRKRTTAVGGKPTFAEAMVTWHSTRSNLPMPIIRCGYPFDGGYDEILTPCAHGGRIGPASGNVDRFSGQSRRGVCPLRG